MSKVPQAWIHRGFEEFARGRFDNGGSNLYVNARGEIETIHRTDVNDDGYVDIVLANTHGYIERGPTRIYKKADGDGKEWNRRELANDSGWMSRIVDVDGDGHISAACCNGTTCGDDCADRLADVFAGATETCDLRDQDCDGNVDEGVSVMLFEDLDGDLYGDSRTLVACAGMARTSTTDIDCDRSSNRPPSRFNRSAAAHPKTLRQSRRRSSHSE